MNSSWPEIHQEHPWNPSLPNKIKDMLNLLSTFCLATQLLNALMLVSTTGPQTTRSPIPLFSIETTQNHFKFPLCLSVIVVYLSYLHWCVINHLTKNHVNTLIKIHLLIWYKSKNVYISRSLPCMIT